MKQTTTFFLLLFALLAPITVSAQLPDGAEAPDWTHTDIDGVEYNLYDMLDEGKMVVLKFSATWCGPCWNYHQTGALDEFWNEHGPNGTNQAQTFYIESDQSTGMDDLLGLTPSSQGNWVAAVDFPIIDLQPGENTDNEYNIGYYPTLYAVCADKKIYELGQVGAGQWEEFIQSCLLAGSVSNIEQAVCYGDGAVELDVSGGVEPISYEWSNGSSEPFLANVGAGVYSVTVTEDNGKDVVIEDIVIEGTEVPIELGSSDIENALCFESATGAISIELEDAVEPVSYSWSNGDDTQNIDELTAGDYTVVATDANGCLFEDSFFVDQPDQIEASYETTPEYCDQGDGSILLDIDGGVGNYTVYSSDGDVDEYLIYNLLAGTVTATVEDGNGCIWEENVEIEFVPQHELFFTPDPAVDCENPIASVQGFVTGGFDDYEYEWSTVNGNIIGDTNGPVIEVDAEGDYDLTVYDLFSGCIVSSSVYVVSNADPPNAEAGDDTPISCELPEPVLQGDGDPGHSLSWTTTDGNIVSGGDTYNPVVDQPGTYIIEVTNPENTCSNTDTVVVQDQLDPADAMYTYQTSGLTMNGTDISTGSNLSGWSWTFGDGNSSTEQNPTHTYAADGTYEVCLSVQNGCGVSELCQNVEVMFDGTSISVISNVQDVLCYDGATGSITLIVNGGSGNYTFSWTGPDGETYSTQSIADLPAGTYTVIITDDMGNSYTADYTVDEPAPVALVGSTVIDNLCFGESNGSVAVDIMGGVGPYSYSFNGGPSQSENIVSGLPVGEVECVVTDANGCTFVAGPYTIQEPTEVTHAVDAISVSCFGDSNGSASVINVQGGVAPYSYLWNIGLTTPDVDGLAPGIYTCMITDHNGCVSEASVQIDEPNILEVDNVVATDATSEEQNNGSISIDVNGGTAPYVVTWNNGMTGTMIQGLVPGEYTYTVVDANGCTIAISDPILIGGSVSNQYVSWAEYITLAPNPSNGNVIVSWDGLSGNNGNITLSTLEGKRLHARQISNATGTWDLSEFNLSNGVYIVLFELDKEAVPYKLVIF